MNNLNKIYFFQMPKQLSRQQRLKKLKKFLLALGLKYKPEAPSKASIDQI